MPVIRKLLALALYALVVHAAVKAGDGTIIPRHPEGIATFFGLPERRDCAGGEMMIAKEAGGPPSFEGEGLAVAHKKVDSGVTVFLLKYRIVENPGDAMHMPKAHMNDMTTLTERAKTGPPVEIPIFEEANAMEDGRQLMTLALQRACAKLLV